MKTCMYRKKPKHCEPHMIHIEIMKDKVAFGPNFSSVQFCLHVVFCSAARMDYAKLCLYNLATIKEGTLTHQVSYLAVEYSKQGFFVDSCVSSIFHFVNDNEP